MLALRRLWTVLVGACLGVFLARVVVEWLLDLDGAWVTAVILAAGALGAVLSIGEARRIKPMDLSERRDAFLGWGALIGGTAAIACLLAPMPWGAFAAVSVLAVTVVVLRRLRGPQRCTRT